MRKKIIAISDIHGSLSSLRKLIIELESKYNLSQIQLVFLGDYIDRGPSSLGVLDYLMELKSQHSNSVFLLGNHEYYFLSGNSWKIEGIPSIVDEIENLDPKHHQFIQNLSGWYESKSFIFVHGGIPRDSQHPSMCTLKEILTASGVHHTYVGKTVVSGHVPFQVIRKSKQAICIDTGCTIRGYGHLTAVILCDESGSILEQISISNPDFE